LAQKFVVRGLGFGGARRRAIYTLTESQNELAHPEDYLRKVFVVIDDYPVRRVHEFLPWNLDGVRQSTDQLTRLRA